MFRIEVGKIALEEVVFSMVTSVVDDVIGDTPLYTPPHFCPESFGTALASCKLDKIRCHLGLKTTMKTQKRKQLNLGLN